MKKFSMLMLLAGATYALTGCMITDYPCITDTENPDYATCATNTGAVLHGTGGWAHIIESSQTATDNNGDGLYSNFIAFVSQDTTGMQSIAQVAEVGPGATFLFHSDLYAQGAQKVLKNAFSYSAQGNNPVGGPNWPLGTPTAAVPNPGVVGAPLSGNCAAPEAVLGTGSPAFDYVLTTNCLVADADLSVLVSYFTRTGEAGRVAGGSGAITMADRISVLKNGVPTANGLQFTLKQGDLNVVVSQGGMSKTLDMSHLYGRSLTFDLDRKGVVGNAWAKQNGITGSDLMATREQLVGFSKSMPVTINLTIYGQTRTFTTKIAQGFDAQLLAATLDAASGEGANQTGSRRR